MRPLLDREPRLADLPKVEADDAFRLPGRSEPTGRPLGSGEFVAAIEKRLARTVAPRKRSRKPCGRRGDQEVKPVTSP